VHIILLDFQLSWLCCTQWLLLLSLLFINIVVTRATLSILLLLICTLTDIILDDEV